MASDITGYNLYNRQTETFEFREGLVMCNILLADEINRRLAQNPIVAARGDGGGPRHRGRQ